LVEDDLGDHFSGIRFKPGRKQAGKLPFDSRVTLSTSRNKFLFRDTLLQLMAAEKLPYEKLTKAA